MEIGKKNKKGDGGDEVPTPNKWENDEVWKECDEVLQQLASADVIKVDNGILKIIQSHAKK